MDESVLMQLYYDGDLVSAGAAYCMRLPHTINGTKI